jgi:hypothetical protein
MSAQQSLQEQFEKLKAELIAEMEENRSFAMELWQSRKVKLIPLSSSFIKRNRITTMPNPNLAALLIEGDDRYTTEVSLAEQEEGYYPNAYVLGQVFLDSAQAQSYIEERCGQLGERLKKADLDSLSLPWDYNIKAQYDSYLQNLAEYKERQEQIKAIRVTERILRQQLDKVLKEIEEIEEISHIISEDNNAPTPNS